MGCGAVLIPMPYQGRARAWCSTSCQRWARRHPGQRRPVDTDVRDRAALRQWADDGWEVSVQPWNWPVNWATRARARAVLAELDAAVVAAP